MPLRSNGLCRLALPLLIDQREVLSPQGSILWNSRPVCTVYLATHLSSTPVVISSSTPLKNAKTPRRPLPYVLILDRTARRGQPQYDIHRTMQHLFLSLSPMKDEHHLVLKCRTVEVSSSKSSELGTPSLVVMPLALMSTDEIYRARVIRFVAQTWALYPKLWSTSLQFSLSRHPNVWQSREPT